MEIIVEKNGVHWGVAIYREGYIIAFFTADGRRNANSLADRLFDALFTFGLEGITWKSV
jgi:hypothetical protein